MSENPDTEPPVPPPLPPPLPGLGRNWLGFVSQGVLMPLAGVLAGTVALGAGGTWPVRALAGIWIAILTAMVAYIIVTAPRDHRRWRKRDREVAEWLEKARAYYHL